MTRRFSQGERRELVVILPLFGRITTDEGPGEGGCVGEGEAEDVKNNTIKMELREFARKKKKRF